MHVNHVHVSMSIAFEISHGPKLSHHLGTIHRAHGTMASSARSSTNARTASVPPPVLPKHVEEEEDEDSDRQPSDDEHGRDVDSDDDDDYRRKGKDVRWTSEEQTAGWYIRQTKLFRQLYLANS